MASTSNEHLVSDDSDELPQTEVKRRLSQGHQDNLNGSSYTRGSPSGEVLFRVPQDLEAEGQYITPNVRRNTRDEMIKEKHRLEHEIKELELSIGDLSSQLHSPIGVGDLVPDASQGRRARYTSLNQTTVEPGRGNNFSQDGRLNHKEADTMAVDVSPSAETIIRSGISSVLGSGIGRHTHTSSTRGDLGGDFYTGIQELGGLRGPGAAHEYSRYREVTSANRPGAELGPLDDVALRGLYTSTRTKMLHNGAQQEQPQNHTGSRIQPGLRAMEGASHVNHDCRNLQTTGSLHRNQLENQMIPEDTFHQGLPGASSDNKKALLETSYLPQMREPLARSSANGILSQTASIPYAPVDSHITDPPRESRPVHSHGYRKALPYDGKSNWLDYLMQFGLIAKVNKWNDQAKALELAISLKGSALETLNDLTVDEREDYTKLTTALTARFNIQNQSELYLTQLRGRVRKPDETVADLAYDIKRLTRLAHPLANKDTRDPIAIQGFIEALNDTDMELAVRIGQPTTIEDAVRRSLEYETFTAARRRKIPIR